MNPTKPLILNILSIICGLWFMLTSWIWIFIFNLILSFPVGAIGVVLLLTARYYDPKSKLNKVSIVIHSIGVFLAIVSLIVMVYFPKWGIGKHS